MTSKVMIRMELEELRERYAALATALGFKLTKPVCPDTHSDILLRADALRGFYISHGHKLPPR